MKAALDDALRRALQTAAPDETLTAVAELDLLLPRGTELSPRDFASRAEWREAVVSQQLDLSRSPVDEIVDRLRTAGVQVAAPGPTPILRGTPRQLEEVSRMKGVRSLSLDKTITLIEPRRPSKVATDP